MWTRAELKSNGRLVMSQNYWSTVLVGLLVMLSTGGMNASNSSSFNRATTNANLDLAEIFILLGVIFTFIFMASLITLVVAIFVLNPLEIGCRRYLISARQAPGDLALVGFGFKYSYMNIVTIQFLRNLFIFLWSLLLVIPGIIKSYEYRMIPYILAENPSMDYQTAFARSKSMMMGEKWNAFVLDLSFIGWHILGILTCGALSVFYVVPYQISTNAELYEALRGNIEKNANRV